MPRPTKRRRACLRASAIANRKKKTTITVEADTHIPAEVDTPLAVVDTPIIYSESEESLEDESELDQEEEQSDDLEQEIQDLSMATDVYKELMKNIIDVDFSSIEFKYQRGPQVCRVTLWRHKKAQQEMQRSVTGCRPLTAYFAPLNTSAAIASSATILEPKTEAEIRIEKLLAGIQDLRKKLKSKKEIVPIGQNYQRHLA
ncbi:hypothetical protein BDZ91DRAFT_851977, partial [Kalaharituber pfeilii]